MLIYLDTDVLLLAEIGELFDCDLGGHPLGAVTSVMPSWAVGYELLGLAARRMDGNRAAEFRKRIHSLYDTGFAGFNAGVLLMDLAEMRRRESAHELLAAVERYGMNDNEALVYWAGPDRHELPFEWNFVPRQRFTGAPKILHWAGLQKPWGRNYVIGKPEWDRCRAAHRKRMTSMN